MDSPEYLDLDALDFSEEGTLDSTLTGITPKRPYDDPASSNSSLSGGVGKTGPLPPGSFPESKFRPVRRVQPLTHQPPHASQQPSSDTSKTPLQVGSSEPSECTREKFGVSTTRRKQLLPGKPHQTDWHKDSGYALKTSEGQSKRLHLGKGSSALDEMGKSRLMASSSLDRHGKSRASPYSFHFLWKSLGDLEHFDLDLDSILDVPYANYQAQAPDTQADLMLKSPVGVHCSNLGMAVQGCSSATQHGAAAPRPETRRGVSGDVPLTVHSRVTKGFPGDTQCFWEQFAACKSTGGQDTNSSAGGGVECEVKGISIWGEEKEGPGCSLMGVEPPPLSDDSCKAKTIVTAIAEGHVNLLRKQLSESAERIRDVHANNLFHMAAQRGQLECLQYLTSALPEDGLLESNAEGLTPTALAIKHGYPECVVWLVTETDAATELSATSKRASLVHYAARHGQERILIWLLQHMQEVGVSLDGADPDGNTAAHLAASHGQLGCLQTLVEYGASVSLTNKGGHKPLQSAERGRHATCARYLVVVETCVSLASQVVKLTKQIREKTADGLCLQNQLQSLVGSQHPAALPKELQTSRQPGVSTECKQEGTGRCDADNANKSLETAGVWRKPSAIGSADVAKQQPQQSVEEEDTDAVLRSLLGEEISCQVPKEQKLTLEFPDRIERGEMGRPGGPSLRELGFRCAGVEQRPSSSSSTDSSGSTGQQRTENTWHRVMSEKRGSTDALHGFLRRHDTRSLRTEVDRAGSTLCTETVVRSVSLDSGIPPTDVGSSSSASTTPELTSPHGEHHCSPKSALKSPTSKSRGSSKLHVTFEEPLVHVAPAEATTNAPVAITPVETLKQGLRGLLGRRTETSDKAQGSSAAEHSGLA
uniref:synphilin-1-like isoform X2 n=1 Tax=Myxine glutinosa TaxID=7769 RepID=UPI00358EA3C2